MNLINRLRGNNQRVTPNPESTIIEADDTVKTIDIDDYNSFEQALDIAEACKKLMGEDSESRRGNKRRGRVPTHYQEAFNASLYQTSEGFFLDLTNNGPYYLDTPWGQLRIEGTIDDNKINDIHELLTSFGATIHPDMSGLLGRPIYALHTLNGKKLPDPTLKPTGKYWKPGNVRDVLPIHCEKYYSTHSFLERPSTLMENWDMDIKYLKQRSAKEKLIVPGDPDDITTGEGLKKIFTPGMVIKYSYGNGIWHYALLTRYTEFDSIGIEFRTREEILPYSNVAADSVIYSGSFEKGIVIRRTTNEEIAGIVFSLID